MTARAASDAGGELVVASTLELTEHVVDANVPPLPANASRCRSDQL